MVKSHVSTDSAFIVASLIARHPGMVERAVTAAVLKHISGLSRAGMTASDIVQQAVAYKAELEKRHSEGLGELRLDVEDPHRDVLRVAKAATAVAKHLKSVPPSSHTARASAEEVALINAQVIGQRALDLIPVHSWVKQGRSPYSMNTAFGLLEEYNQSSQRMIAAFHDQCLLNGSCRKAAGVVFPDLVTFGDEVDVRPGAVITANPDLFGPVLRNSVQADFTLLIDTNELRESVSSEFRGLATGLRDDFRVVQDELATLGRQQKDLMTWLNNQAAKEEARRRQKDLQEQMQRKWQAAQKAIAVAATVASLFDAKLGSDIGRVGGAGLALVKTGVELVQAANALSKGLTVGTALGSAAATGNFIGAAITVVGVFGPSAPSPEQVILDQINALRNDMRALQSEMHQRFDRIDTTLNKIYVDVLGKLDEINMALGTLNRKSDLILDELDGIEATLLRHQSLLASFFQTNQRGPLLIAYATALGRPDVAVTPTMTDGEFQDHEGIFRAWASMISGNNIEVPLEAKSTADVDLRSQLEGPALEHIAFLNVVAHQRGWPSFAPLNREDQLHNPFTWMIAAGGYSELEREWPLLAAAATSAAPDVRREEVAAPGHAILSAQQQIPKREAGNLLGDAIGNLESKYRAYGRQLMFAEESWQQKLLPGILNVDPTLPRVPVWRSDPNQEFNCQPIVSVWRQNSEEPEGGLNLGQAVVAKIPAIYRTAAWLNSFRSKNQLRVTVAFEEFQWQDVEIVHHPPPRDDISGELPPPPPPPPPEEKVTVGRGLKYTATVSYRGQGLQRATVEIRSNDPSPRPLRPLPLSEVLPKFGAKFADLRPDPALAQADISAARKLLWKDHFLPALTTWQMKRTEEMGEAVRLAAAELDGALRVLDCLLTLGLPTARSADELMRAALDGRPVWEGGLCLVTAPDFLSHLSAVPGGSVPATPASAPIMNSFPDYLNEVTKVPLEVLSERTETYQNALDAGDYKESYRDIQFTLARMALAGDLVDLVRP